MLRQHTGKRSSSISACRFTPGNFWEFDDKTHSKKSVSIMFRYDRMYANLL